MALIDADGKRTELGFDTDAHRQVVTDRLGNTTTYVYDDQGNVTAVTDPLGNQTTYAYDSLGNETRTTDPLGHTQTWAYGGSVLGEDPRHLRSTTDALGNVTTYSYYRASTPLNQFYEPLGRTTIIGFDGRGNVSQLSLPGDQRVQYAYNAQGQRVSETDPAGHVTQYTVDAQGRETGRSWTRTDADGQVRTLRTSQTLDAEGRVLTETDAVGGVTKRDYLGSQVVRETDPLGRVTTYDYDAQARLIKTTYPDGTLTATGYDANGNAVSETDRAGRTTRHTYDALNRLVKTTAPDGTFTETTYDAAGRVIQTRDGLGQVTTHTYDDAGRLTAVTAPDGGVIRYTYDAHGNRTQTTDAAGQVTRFAYDALNRLVKTTYPDGGTATTGWRVDGLKQSETDPAGVIREYGYDAAGRLNQVKESAGSQVTVYAYDEAGNKIRQTDAEGRITRWTYDDANRLTSRIVPSGEKEFFQYDAVGRLTTHVDFQGGTTLYTYDAADRRTQATFPDGRSVQWTYTADGQVASILEGLGTTRYQYDTQGRVVQETRPDGAVLAWSYDAAGNITERSSPSGTTRYSYDAVGRLIKVTDSQKKTTTYTYDGAGRLTNTLLPNGTQEANTYDSNGRLIQRLHAGAGGALLTGVAYTLAANGQRTEVRELDSQSTVVNGQAQNPLRTTQYGYDGAGRLVSETVVGRGGATLRTVAYAYDKVGNRVQKTQTAAGVTATTVYTYDADDRLTAETPTVNGVATTITYGWDAAGRLAQKTAPGQVTVYQWDREDHLVAVKRGATVAAAQTVVTYAYDALGNRVKQVEKTAQGERTTTFLTDTTFPDAQVVESKTQLGSQTESRRYVWGAGLIAEWRNGQPAYYHADGLGSVKALSDGAGALTDTYEYAAFGEVLGHSGASGQPYRFAGEYFDPLAGMQYHRARWYDPQVGRFAVMDRLLGMQSRPITLHKYVYGNNNPITYTDPSGRFGISSIGAALNIGLTLMTAYSTIQTLGEFASGERELTAKEVGLAVLWAYVGSKAGPLFGKLESVLRKTGCLSNSFSSNTLVETEHGLRRIDQIKIGDLVMSRDLETGENELQPVSDVITSTKINELVILTLQSGSDLEVTPEHLILVNGEWVQAQHIKQGMTLSAYDGKEIKVTQTKREARELAVYDLTVAKNRNFFASKDKVLVHNISICEKAAQGLAKYVPKTCTRIYMCKEFAQSFEKLLLDKGMKGTRLCVKSRTGRIWSDNFNTLISTNGDHVAVLVGELVFDNLYPDGIPISEWKNDLGIGMFEDMSMHQEAIGSPGCIK